MRNCPRAARTTTSRPPSATARSPSRLIPLDDAGEERERRASVDSLAGWGTSTADDAGPTTDSKLDEKLAADDDEQEEIAPEVAVEDSAAAALARRRAASDARTSLLLREKRGSSFKRASFAALPPQAPSLDLLHDDGASSFRSKRSSVSFGGSTVASEERPSTVASSSSDDPSPRDPKAIASRRASVEQLRGSGREPPAPPPDPTVQAAYERKVATDFRRRTIHSLDAAFGDAMRARDAAQGEGTFADAADGLGELPGASLIRRQSTARSLAADAMWRELRKASELQKEMELATVDPAEWRGARRADVP